MLNDKLIDTIPYNDRPSAPYSLRSCACCWSETGPFASGTTPSKLPIYVCKTCIVTAALASGWVAPETAVELEGLVESYQTHVRNLEEQLKVAGQDVDRLAEGIGARVYDFVQERLDRRPEETPTGKVIA